MKKIFQVFAISLLAIGLIFGRYIGRYFINKFNNGDTSVNDGKKYANKYIENTDTVKLQLEKFKFSSGFFHVKGVSNAELDDQSAVIIKYNIVFYSNKLKKYFDIMYFFNNNDFEEIFGSFISNLDTAENITAVVNKNELDNADYGTPQKPVPIFYFTLSDQSKPSYFGTIQETQHPFKGNEAQFKTWLLNYNVGHYLSYVKSKADFEKMFGKTN